MDMKIKYKCLLKIHKYNRIGNRKYPSDFFKCKECGKFIKINWNSLLGSILNKNKKAIFPWFGRLTSLKFRGLYFKWGVPPDEPSIFMFPKWKFGWVSSQMNEFLFLGYCYLSWSM